MSVEDKPGEDARSYVSWLSGRDLTTMVDRCIEMENIGFDVFFGASGNTWKIIRHSARLGDSGLHTAGQRGGF